MLRKLLSVSVALIAVLTVSPAFALAEGGAAPPDRPLSLEECVNMALGGHPKIKAALQDSEAGSYSTRQAIAGFWPTAGFQASRNHIASQRVIRFTLPAFGNATSGGGGQVTSVTTAEYISNNFTFDVNWTLFDFGRTYYRVRGLAELEDLLLSSLTAAEQKVAYDVMDAYFGLLQAQSLVEVANQTMAAAQSHLKQAQAFYDVGVKPRFDVTQAEVEYNDARLGVIKAEDAVKAARASLNTKLGYAPLAGTTVEPVPLSESLDGAIESYIDRAMMQRPELKGQEASMRSAEAGVKGAYADFLPTITAGATQNWSKEDHSDMLSNQNVIVAANVPIFEGFRSAAALGEARARALSEGYRLEDMKRDITLEVSTAYLDVEDARARVDALESSVKKAEENLEIAQGRYEAGVGPLIEVTDAQVGLTSARTDMTNAVYDYHIAYTRLLRSVGAPVPGKEVQE